MVDQSEPRNFFRPNMELAEDIACLKNVTTDKMNIVEDSVRVFKLGSGPMLNIYIYNIARALVLSKSYWAIMNKIFMYARPCSIKWRMQFHFSGKISVEFSARSFCLSFGNVKIILSNPNPTSSLWLMPGNDVYFNVSILILFVSIFIEYLYFVWLRCFCERKS